MAKEICKVFVSPVGRCKLVPKFERVPKGLAGVPECAAAPRAPPLSLLVPATASAAQRRRSLQTLSKS